MQFVKILFFIILPLLLAKPVFSQCDSTFLGEDKVICEGTSIVLDAGSGALSYLWSNGSTNQTITVSEGGQYWCSIALVDSTNLVVNGDFSDGNGGFQSDYIYNPTSVYTEGTYSVTTNPHLVHPDFSNCTDHTTGNGKMMVLNGAPIANQKVWYESIPVEPNTGYHYSGWFTSVHPANPAVMDLSINGVSIAQINLTGATCLWQNFYNFWNSGSNTTIDLQIVNQNTTMSGNDFAIDDISLFKACVVTDTINIVVSPAPVVNLGNDTTICEGSTLVLNPAPLGAGFLWQDGSIDPTFEVTETGLYWVIVANYFGCISTDSIQVTVAPVPVIELGNDTTLCEGQTLMLNPGGGYDSYVWQDNSTGPTYIVNSEGTYWVTVYGVNNCATSDTIKVQYVPWPAVDLGNDTTLCAGDQLVLSAAPGYATYTWQDNSSGSSYTVTQTGLYWCMVSNACSTASDSIYVNFSPLPVIDLGNDTVICNGEVLTLQVGSNYASYQWQDGSNFPFLDVSSAGVYSLVVTNTFGCSNSDEIFVDVSSPQVDLGGNSFHCDGDTVTLNAGPGFDSYLWQDGSAAQFIDVTGSGEYNVSVTDQYNCTASDSVFIEFIQPPVANLGNDQTFCAGDTLILQAPQGDYSYYWNGQPGGNTYAVTSQGDYSLSVVNQCDSVTDDIYVTVVDIPPVDLGEDQLAFPGETVQLDAGMGYDTYLWQNGSTEEILSIDANTVAPPNDIYTVDVTLGTCKSSDSVKVEFFDVAVPLVITPNGDGLNDIFRPFPGKWLGINQSHMEVFNRWGERIWVSDDFESGWDGKQNGKVVSDGTYYWLLEVYYGPQELKKVLKGSLTVLGSQD